MKIIPMPRLREDASLFDEIDATLKQGGLVCLPCGGSYRILADLHNVKAVNKLFASKGRTHTAPSLVFVDGEKMLAGLAAEISPTARSLAAELWPGPLTILFKADEHLPGKVVKQVAKANGHVGVRVPEHEVARRVVARFGRPLLVSSANRQKKQGAGSPAQVRKNFRGKVDLFVEDGDLAAKPASTVVRVDGEGFVITREGAIDAARLRAALA